MAKILVIEDDDLVRNSLHDIFDIQGHSTMSTTNGIEGIEYAKQYLPDIILCDIFMPEMDGYGVLRNIRNIPEIASIPFIFLTGIGDYRSIDSDLQLGADGYILKPFDVEDLLSAVSTLLGLEK